MLIALTNALPFMTGMPLQNPMMDHALWQTATNPMSQIVPPPPRQSGIQEGWKRNLAYSSTVAAGAIGLGGLLMCVFACNSNTKAEALRDGAKLLKHS